MSKGKILDEVNYMFLFVAFYTAVHSVIISPYVSLQHVLALRRLRPRARVSSLRFLHLYLEKPIKINPQTSEGCNSFFTLREYEELLQYFSKLRFSTEEN